MDYVESGNRAIKVVVVAPAMLAWGLERMVHGAYPRFELGGSAGNLAQAQGVLQASAPDVVVVDIDGGYDPTRSARSRHAPRPGSWHSRPPPTSSGWTVSW